VEIDEIGLPGCYAIRPRVFSDDRGAFVKMFPAPGLRELGTDTDWQEELWSSSRRGVLRGMHFQVPPADHAKLVYCVHGEILDVMLDLRRGSPAFGQHRHITLSSANGIGLYVPSGCAHGFLSMRDESTVLYKITSVHSPENDRGIAWDSFGFDWPVDEPMMSDRDRRHPRLADFVSPFVFGTASRG
jgi:dTDP-4-dehydrorhamnose 3,5-epimerase